MSQHYRELRPSQTNQPQRPIQAPEVKSKKRPQIYAACERCRSLKVKCDGARPSCAKCTRNQQPCKYDTVTGNETRTHALKRSLETLQHENAELHELLGHLRSRPRLEAHEILHRLRSDPNTKVSALLTFIKEGDLLAEGFARSGTFYDVDLPKTQSPASAELASRYSSVYCLELPNWRASRHDFISSMLYETFGDGADLILGAEASSTSSSKSPSLSLSIAQSSPRSIQDTDDDISPKDFSLFPDNRIALAKCQPWTSVIKSEDLFRRLLSIYFTWLHPTFCLFDENLLLKDLIANEKNPKYCSPMLVNSILSLSYLHYVLLEPSKDNTPTTHGLAFVEEALMHYTESQNETTLTNVQGIMLIGIIYQCLGKDKAALTYQELAVKQARDLQMNTNRESQHEDNDFDRVQQVTLWGVFQINNLSSFGLRRPIMFDALELGPIPEMRSDRKSAAEHWIPLPYPEHVSRPHHAQATFNARCRLWQIGAEINLRWFETGNFLEVRKLAEAEAFYSRLLQWADSIDHSMRPTASSPPHVLLLFTWFHTMVMEIFRPFAERGAARLQTLASSKSQADVIFSESVRQLKMLFVLLTTQFDPRLIPLEFLQVLTLICLESRKDVMESSESCKLFIMSYSIMSKLSHSFPVLLAVLRFIRDSVSMSPAASETPPALDMVFAAFNKQLQARRNSINFDVTIAVDANEQVDEAMSSSSADGQSPRASAASE